MFNKNITISRVLMTLLFAGFLFSCSVVTAFAQKQIVPKVEVNARVGIGVSHTPQYVSPVVYDDCLTVLGRVQPQTWVGVEASVSSFRFNMPADKLSLKNPYSRMLFVGPSLFYKYGGGNGWEIIEGLSMGYTYLFPNKDLQAPSSEYETLLKAQHGFGMNISSEFRYAYRNVSYVGLGYKVQMRGLLVGESDSKQRRGLFSGIPFISIGFRF